jgi:hypothetical protein
LDIEARRISLQPVSRSGRPEVVNWDIGRVIASMSVRPETTAVA